MLRHLREQFKPKKRQPNEQDVTYTIKAEDGEEIQVTNTLEFTDAQVAKMQDQGQTSSHADSLNISVEPSATESSMPQVEGRLVTREDLQCNTGEKNAAKAKK
ncbi:MAG TPA: hypothetical protein VJB65_02870 [Patescibacteria group bacterium]|nr:hypothetical protein [Patescibacteria group bacterium]